MLNNITPYAPCPQLARLRDARLILEINADENPFIDAEGRREIRTAKRAAWVVLAAVCEQLVETLDIASGDPDLEPNGDELDGSTAEDDFADHPNHYGPGCPIGDPDAAIDDSNCDDINMDLEPQEEGR